MRWKRTIDRGAGAGLLLAALSGCAAPQAGTGAGASAASGTVKYVPPPDRFLTSSLLTFDSPTDLAFVHASDPRPGMFRIDPDPARPGNRLLAVADGASGYINLSSLVRGRTFPGPWDLIGVRYRCAGVPGVPVIGFTRTVGGTVTEQHRMIEARTPGDAWQTLWFNSDPAPSIASAPAMTQPAQDVDYRITCSAASGSLMIDDIVLAQSRATVCEGAVPDSNARWAVTRKGRAWEFAWGGQVALREPAAPFADHGYAVVEGDSTRVLLQSDQGNTIAVNRLGRLIQNGRVVSDANLIGVAKAQGESTPLVEVVGTTASDDGTREDGNAGRVERTLPGDRDNDGYDETRGCAVVRAGGPRINVRLSSRGGNGSVIRWPILEVRGLPPGTVSVYVEGQTVPWVTRLADGRVVVELPITLADRVDIQVRVR